MILQLCGNPHLTGSRREDLFPFGRPSGFAPCAMVRHLPSLDEGKTGFLFTKLAMLAMEGFTNWACHKAPSIVADSEPRCRMPETFCG